MDDGRADTPAVIPARTDPWPWRLIGDLRTAVAFCTCLPVGAAATATDARHFVAASWALPVAGAFVGAAGGLVYWFAWHVGLPAAPAAALALAATLALTGALHEDGLADTADGLGGGSRENKLAIMRDSRIGTFGACALGMSLLLRWTALVSFTEPGRAVTALIAAHVASRAALPAFLRIIPPARADGLSATAGRPSRGSVGIAAALAAALLGVLLGPAALPEVFALLMITGWLLGLLAMRQFGGQTGDVLGALEQAAEIVVLLLAVVQAKGAP
jgi:adenosylcobinamide-GDP ribazoletransferase